MKRIHCWKRMWIAILVWSILVWIPNTHVFAHSIPQADLLQTRLAMTQSELSFLQSRLEYFTVQQDNTFDGLRAVMG